MTAPQISASHRLIFNLEGEKPISQGCYTCGRVYCEVSAVVLLSHTPFHSLTLSCLGSWTLADVVNQSFHRETITAEQGNKTAQLLALQFQKSRSLCKQQLWHNTVWIRWPSLHSFWTPERKSPGHGTVKSKREENSDVGRAQALGRAWGWEQ